MDAEAVSRFLNGSTQPFWNMNDRLWLRNGTAAAIFATYNGDQPNDLQLVHDLCSEAGCMPSAIVAVNGETNGGSRPPYPRSRPRSRALALLSHPCWTYPRCPVTGP